MSGERNLNPAREKNESFEEYKKRRKANNDWLRFYLKGEYFWESKTDGTYVRKKI